MAPKKVNQKDLKEAQAATGKWSISKCSRQNLASLVLGGLLQERDLINWRLPFRDPFPMESIDEVVSFCSFSERGSPSPPVHSSAAFSTSMGLSCNTSTPTQSAISPFSSTFVKPSSKLSPIWRFSAIFSA
jgi:hypothetical protein